MLTDSLNLVPHRVNLDTSQISLCTFASNAHQPAFHAKQLYYVHHACLDFIVIVDNALIHAQLSLSDTMVMMSVLPASQHALHHISDSLVQESVKLAALKLTILIQ